MVQSRHSAPPPLQIISAVTYGKELILDIRECNPLVFTRAGLKQYFERVCEIIHMELAEDALYFWDDLDTPEGEKETEPHLVGTSAVQFIKTSNITIHTLDILKCAYINIFSCKDFDHQLALLYSVNWFEGELANSSLIERMR